MARELRRNQIDYHTTPFYHVVSRCVRSLRLLGSTDDARKQRLLEYVALLAESSAIQVAGFAIMDNHLHMLLHADPAQAAAWSDLQVVHRWLHLHPPRNGYFLPVEPTAELIEQLAADPEFIAATRDKLCSIPHYMKELKQRIAQEANREERVVGSFWAGRYKLRPVLSDRQLLVTLTYIDLNPFAAGRSPTPELGRYTSLETRLGHRQAAPARPVLIRHRRPAQTPPSSSKASTTAYGTAALPPAALSVSSSTRPVTSHPGSPRRALAPTTRTTVPGTPSTAPAQGHAGPARGTDDVGQDLMSAPASGSSRIPVTSGDWTSQWLMPLSKDEPRALPDVMRSNKISLLPGLTFKRYLRLVDDAARLLRPNKRVLPRDSRSILGRLNLTPLSLATAVGQLADTWSDLHSAPPPPAYGAAP